MFLTLLIIKILYSTLPTIVDPANILCSDLHVAKISEKIVRWEELAPYFDISREEQEEIRDNLSGQYILQKREMLWRWKQKVVK